MRHKWHDELEEFANFSFDKEATETEMIFTFNQVLAFAEQKVKNNVDLADVSRSYCNCGDAECKREVRATNEGKIYVVNNFTCGNVKKQIDRLNKTKF